MTLTTSCPDSAETRRTATDPQQFPPLELETRTHVNTELAAHWLLRRTQTLRAWACLENGPLRPIRINGRLAWPVAELKRVLGLSCGEQERPAKRQQAQ